ncbi:MAG: 1-acyl-sn-glycerol-3-phosphate acyltransferase [Treponema sp.]|nr:1-acyl-sn-glycerol-3-phosphate acyltransferase [Treponema sp.]
MGKKHGTIKKANNFIYWILKILMTPILWGKYRFKFEEHKDIKLKRPCLILANHQTAFDQFAVGVGFPFGINFIASDSIFRHGILSWLMKTIARPIPFSKGSADSSAIKNIFSVIKQGGAIGMFPSGNRSFFGDECMIRPGIGKLAKKLGVPVYFVLMRGGYNTKPRWKNKPNKGIVNSSITRIIDTEELKNISSDQLEDIVKQELCFNESEWNAKQKIEFHSRHKAEFLERVLFWCPECKSLNKLSSKKCAFFCTLCGMRVRVNAAGFFEKISHAENCPNTILKWGKMQLEYIKSINYNKYLDKPLFSDRDIRLSLAIRSKKDEFLKKGTIEFFGDKIRICGKDFIISNLKDISIQSYNRLMIYTDDGEYTADMSARSNAVKYMVCFYHQKNIIQNIEDGHYGY